MNPRSTPLEGLPTSLERVPRLVDVLDESQWAAWPVEPSGAAPTAKAPAENLSEPVQAASAEGGTGVNVKPLALDAVLDTCMAVCGPFIEQEIQRRLQQELDQHAQARFEAWLSQARHWWDRLDDTSTADRVAPTEVLDDRHWAPRTSTRLTPSPDWDGLREQLADRLSRRGPD